MSEVPTRGADQKADGKFDLAEGGTIFLDEIGELPLAIQGKLLRVLQDRDFNRVGGTETIKTDVRIVAATNRDLEKLVSAGEFRSDLYYRIKVVELALPPLRERGAPGRGKTRPPFCDSGCPPTWPCYSDYFTHGAGSHDFLCLARECARARKLYGVRRRDHGRQ